MAEGGENNDNLGQLDDSLPEEKEDKLASSSGSEADLSTKRQRTETQNQQQNTFMVPRKAFV